MAMGSRELEEQRGEKEEGEETGRGNREGKGRGRDD